MVRVDHGTEACLMLFVQDYLRNLRGNITCQPYVQTRSREVLNENTDVVYMHVYVLYIVLYLKNSIYNISVELRIAANTFVPKSIDLTDYSFIQWPRFHVNLFQYVRGRLFSHIFMDEFVSCLS